MWWLLRYLYFGLGSAKMILEGLFWCKQHIRCMFEEVTFFMAEVRKKDFLFFLVNKKAPELFLINPLLCILLPKENNRVAEKQV